MFCPTGPFLLLASGGGAGNIALSGIDRNNPILRVSAGAEARVEISFNGPSIDLRAFSGECFFHIPENCTSINATVFAPSGINAYASLNVGQEV